MCELTELPAKTINLDKINSLMQASKAYWGYDKQFLDEFMRIFRITEKCLLSSTTKEVYLKKDLIGFYSFVKHNDSLELDTFFLHPEYIGKGFGRKLWNLCLRTMQDMGYSSFYIVAEPHAENFYKKMNCIKSGEQPSPMGKDRTNSIYHYSS